MSRGMLLDTIQVSTLSFVSLASLLANALLLAASLHRKSDTTSGDMLVAAMAVADVLVALAIPVIVMADFEMFGDGNSMACVVANSPAVSFPCLSLFMLVALTLERCINIFLPLRAITLITGRRVLGVIVGVYLYALLLTLLLPLTGHNLYVKEKTESNLTADCNFAAVATAPLVAFLLLGNLVLGMLLLLLLNGAIFYVARKHLHRITQMSEYRRQKTHDNAVMFMCQLYVLSYLPVTVALCIDFQGFSVFTIQEWRAPFLLYALGMFMGAFSTVVFPLILISNNSRYKRWINSQALPHVCRQTFLHTETRGSSNNNNSRDLETGPRNHSRDLEPRSATDLCLQFVDHGSRTCASVPEACSSDEQFDRSMTSSSGFSVFVVNLTIADFLMGIYIAVIGVADERFRGKYLHHDDKWKSSMTCKVAGFLSLLSSEMSALVICLITVDRFIVLRFPFSTLRFERTSATLACLLTWLACCFVAGLPLLPMTAHWEFYSQTGICIPLPVTRRVFGGRLYSFSVLIVFNFILFVLISSGQAIIYWSIQSNTLKTNTTKVSRDMTIARRLISVAVTDFLCWFPIGLCRMLALIDIPIPGEVNVALAIFVLPLNSALNPFMYTFNTWAEKRRKSYEDNLMKWLVTHPDILLRSEYI